MFADCPGCRLRLKVGEGNAGKMVKCTRCGQAFSAPALPQRMSEVDRSPEAAVELLARAGEFISHRPLLAVYGLVGQAVLVLLLLFVVLCLLWFRDGGEPMERVVYKTKEVKVPVDRIVYRDRIVKVPADGGKNGPIGGEKPKVTKEVGELMLGKLAGGQAGKLGGGYIATGVIANRIRQIPMSLRYRVQRVVDGSTMLVQAEASKRGVNKWSPGVVFAVRGMATGGLRSGTVAGVVNQRFIVKGKELIGGGDYWVLVR